jgi:hypothetical protein
MRALRMTHMNRLVLALALASSMAAPALVSFSSAGCNTAELHEPPPTDAGDLACDAAPAVTCGDAGTSTATCAADPDASDPSVQSLPPGTSYAVACRVQTHGLDPLGECAVKSQCTCIPSDAGGSWACTK